MINHGAESSVMGVLLTHHRQNSAAAAAALDFELQFAVPAEELECGVSSRDLRRISRRVETVLALATQVYMLLEPRGWRLLTVRFEEEVCVILAKQASAEMVAQDLAHVPESVLGDIGESIHLCGIIGDHIFELQLADGRLIPLSPADSTVVDQAIV